MPPRTKRQREIFDYIESFIEIRGYKPSYQQIARHFQIRSKSAVAKHIAALENQGLITRYGENGNFNLQLRGKDTAEDAVCEIAWLEISLADVSPESYENEAVYVPKFLLGSLPAEDLRVFRVRDNALIGAHICQGDIAIIEKNAAPRDGDIMLISVEKQFVEFKRYSADEETNNGGINTGFRSKPTFENGADEIEIQGVVRGLIRPSV